MKRSLLFFTVLSIAILFNSCSKDEDTKGFDETLLYGKWRSGTEYYRYDSNGKGATWDEGEDVTEDDPEQEFEWSLVKSELTHIHIMTLGGREPKYYTVTELTATTLKYKDNYRSHSFTKVN